MKTRFCSKKNQCLEPPARPTGMYITYTIGYNNFNNLALPGRRSLQRLTLRFFFSSAFDFKICKKCYYDQKNLIFKKCNMWYQKTQNLMLISNPLTKLQKDSCEKRFLHQILRFMIPIWNFGQKI
jgi:hypothetical protein